MSLAIVITCIIIQTVILTSAVCYWLHLRSVRRMNDTFKSVLQDMVNILNDDPRYTVNIKTVTNKPSKSKSPYDWKVDEQFDKIINKNFPQDK
jgi:hypothetical protein